jgi:hypothetical protein
MTTTERYQPKHLNKGEVESVYRQALQQAEAATISAWITYKRTKAAQETLEQEIKEICPALLNGQPQT